MQHQVDSTTDETLAREGTSFDFDGPEGPPPAVYLTVPSNYVARKSSLPSTEKRKRGRQRCAAANSVTSAGSSDEGGSDFVADGSDAERRPPSREVDGEGGGKTWGARTNKRRLARPSRGSLSDESATTTTTTSAAEVEGSPRSGSGRRRGNVSTAAAAGSRNSSRLQAGSNKSGTKTAAAENAAATAGGALGDAPSAGKRVRKPTPRALAFVSATDSMDQDAPDHSDDDDDDDDSNKSGKGGRGRRSGSGSGKRPARAAATRGSNNSSAATHGGASAGAQGSGRTEEAKDRNREHARKTRLRKKEYVAALQAELSEVSRLHAAEVARRDAANQPNAGRKGLATALLNRFLRWRGGQDDLLYDAMLDGATTAPASQGSPSFQPHQPLQEAQPGVTRDSRNRSSSNNCSNNSNHSNHQDFHAETSVASGRAAVAQMLHPNFALELPVTPYRSPPCLDAAVSGGASGTLSDDEGGDKRSAGGVARGGGVHVLCGLSGAEQDRASLRLLGESLGRGSAQWSEAMANPGLDTCRRGTGARWHFLPLDPGTVSWQEQPNSNDNAYDLGSFADSTTIPDDAVFDAFGDGAGAGFMSGQGTPTATSATKSTKKEASGAAWVKTGTVMACWEAVSLGAKAQGAANEVTCRGMLAATFVTRLDAKESGAKKEEERARKRKVGATTGDDRVNVVDDDGDGDAAKHAMLSALRSPTTANFKLLKLELCFDVMAAMHALQGTVPVNLRHPNPPPQPRLPPPPPPPAAAAAAAAAVPLALAPSSHQRRSEGGSANPNNNNHALAQGQATSAGEASRQQQPPPPSSWALQQFLESQARHPPSSSSSSSSTGSSSHGAASSCRSEQISSGGSSGTGSGGSSPQDGLPHLVSENGSDRSFRAPGSSNAGNNYNNPNGALDRREVRSYSNASSGWHNSSSGHSSSGGGGDSPDCGSGLGSPTSPISNASSAGPMNPSSTMAVTTSSSLSVTSSIQATSNATAMASTAATTGRTPQAAAAPLPTDPSPARTRLVVPPVPVTLAEAWEAYDMHEAVSVSIRTAQHQAQHSSARPPSLPQAAVVVSAVVPFRVVATNGAWAQLTNGDHTSGGHVADLFRPSQQLRRAGHASTSARHLATSRSGSGINFSAPRRPETQGNSTSNSSNSSSSRNGAASDILAVAASGSEQATDLEAILTQAAHGTAASGLVLGPPSHAVEASAAAQGISSSSGTLPACAGKYYLRVSGLAAGNDANNSGNGIGSGSHGGGDGRASSGSNGIPHLLVLIDWVAHVPASALPPHAAAAFLSSHQASTALPPTDLNAGAKMERTRERSAPWCWVLPALTPSQEVSLLWGPRATERIGFASNTSGVLPHRQPSSGDSSHHYPNDNGGRLWQPSTTDVGAAAPHVPPRGMHPGPHHGRFTWAAAAARTVAGKPSEHRAELLQRQHPPPPLSSGSRGSKLSASRAVSMDGYLNAEGWPEESGKSSSRSTTINKRKGAANAGTSTAAAATAATAGNASRAEKAPHQRAGLSVAAARASSAAVRGGSNTGNAPRNQAKTQPPKLTHAATEGFLFGLDFGFGAASPVGLFDGVVVGDHGSVAEDSGGGMGGGTGGSGRATYSFNEDGGVSPASALGLRPQVPMDPSHGHSGNFPGPEVNNSDVFGMGTPTAGASEFLNWGL